MTAAALLAALRARGLAVAAAGGKLRVSPAGRLSDSERAELVGHKPELLRLLAGEGEWPPDSPADTPAAVLIVRPDGSQMYVSLAEYQRLDAAAAAIRAHNDSLPRPGFCRCGCGETILAWKSPHVGRYCAHCGRWLGWVTKTPEVLAAVGPEPVPNTLC
jgi:hypothetical protein